MTAEILAATEHLVLRRMTNDDACSHWCSADLPLTSLENKDSAMSRSSIPFSWAPTPTRSDTYPVALVPGAFRHPCTRHRRPLRAPLHDRHAGRPAPACLLSSWVTQCRTSSSPTAWSAVRQYPRARVPRPDQLARIPRRPERTV